MAGDVVTGADGVRRCRWGADPPDYREYHDHEWGVPLYGDRELFAKLVLDGKKSTIGANLDVPTLGKPLVFSGNTLVYDRPLILTKDNVDQFSGF